MHEQPLSVRFRSGSPALVIIVPARAFPGAVERNRLRRQVREALRRIEVRPRHGQQCIVTVHDAPLPAGRALDTLLFELLRPSGIVGR